MLSSSHIPHGQHEIKTAVGLSPLRNLEGSDLLFRQLFLMAEEMNGEELLPLPRLSQIGVFYA